MAKPMFFYAGIHDSSADAEMDWDEAEQDALESIARAEQHAVV